MELLNSLLSLIEDSIFIGHLAIFIVFFLESIAFIGLIVPGTIFLVLIGFLISRNLLGWDVMFLIPVAIAFGDHVSFYFGERGKCYFKDENLIFKSRYLAKGESFFEKHKNKSIVLGRFIGVVRPLTPFIAGLFRVSKKKFFILNSISILLWTALYFSLGYFFGEALRFIELWSARVGLFVIALVASLVVLYLIKRYVVSREGLIVALVRFLYGNFKTFIIDNTSVKKLVQQYPDFFLHIKNRFVLDKFSGLPLTLILLSFTYVASLFGGITEDVLNSEFIVDADLYLADTFKFFRHAALIKIFFWITALGSWEMVFIFTAILAISIWLWGRRFYVVALLTTIVGSFIFNILGKAIFHRSRPEEGIYLERYFSFPSGHATLATAFYGFLIYFFWRNLKSVKNRINISFFFLALIILIGFSRLYLGVHFLSDIWGGFLLGLLWLIVGVSIGEWGNFKARKKQEGEIIFRYEEKKLDFRNKMIIALLILFGLVSYIMFAKSLKPMPIKMETFINEQGSR